MAGGTIARFHWRYGRLDLFQLRRQSAQATKTMAANQGLYNGFLAAGLIWGLVHPDHAVGVQVQLFFLICVAVAGIYGAITAKRSILFIQTVPAVIAMIVLWFATSMQAVAPIAA